MPDQLPDVGIVPAAAKQEVERSRHLLECRLSSSKEMVELGLERDLVHRPHLEDLGEPRPASGGRFRAVSSGAAPVAKWLPYLAACLGTRRPRRVPVWLARLAVGEVGISVMTQIRGASNAKAKRELGWTPSWSSWREGFKHGPSEDSALAAAKARFATTARAGVKPVALVRL